MFFSPRKAPVSKNVEGGRENGRRYGGSRPGIGRPLVISLLAKVEVSVHEVEPF